MRNQLFIRTTVAITVIAACLTAPSAVRAGLLDSWFKKGEKGPLPAARYDREPPLEFDGGQLTIDLSGRWKLGGSSLVFDESSVVTSGGRDIEPSRLSMGQEARVTGIRIAGGMLSVRRLRVITGRQMVDGLGSSRMSVGAVGAAAPGGPR